MTVHSTNPGDLRHRVRLEMKNDVFNAIGGEVDAWTPLAFLWARIAPVNQSQILDANHKAAEVTHRVLIRFRSDVNPGYRFIYRNRSLIIRSVADMGEEGRFLVCMCEEKQ